MPNTNNINANDLNSLIQSEKKYLDILDIIDSKLSPLWMKQLDSVAPDFSELLKCIQNIVSVNKSFYENLTNINPCDSLDDLLMTSINNMEAPYHRYAEKFINNINQRQDILCVSSIQRFLNDINAQKNEETITLETLFCAPLQRLDVYKIMFNKKLGLSEQSVHQANQLFQTLMIKNSLPPVQLDPAFHSQVGCSKVVDILTNAAIPNYQLQSLPKVLLCDTFNCNEISKRVRLILTVNSLIICSLEEAHNKESALSLLFAPVPSEFISIRTIHTERELIGEYNVQFWVQKQRLLTMKAASKEVRNMWLGMHINSSTRDQSILSWAPLNDIVSKYDIRRQSTKSTANAPKPIRTQDIFTFYNDHAGEISPLVSSSDESEEDDDDDISWKEEEGKKIANSKLEPSSASDKTQSLDKENIVSSFSDTSESFSLPPPVPTKDVNSTKNMSSPTIISGTKSLPSRNISLNKLPSNMMMPEVVTPNLNMSPVPVHPPNARSMSAHQSMNGRPLSYQQVHIPSMPANSPYLQQQQQVPVTTPEPASKKSFMRSVMAAVSSPRSSFRQSKILSKPSIESLGINETASSSKQNVVLPRGSSLKGEQNQKKNTSAVSLDQQILSKAATDHSTSSSLRRYSAAAANMAEPQHATLPPPQNPFGQWSSYVNNQSTPSFISSLTTSSQSSLALTPPLSRSSSPGSLTPVVMNAYTSSEDLSSPPESPDIITHGNTIKTVLYSNNSVKVFHWKEESWYGVEEECLLEVRQTFSNRSCVAIHMKNTGQLYLNAWVLPDTLIVRSSYTDLSLSLHIGNNQSEMDNYLFHCESQVEADRLGGILEQMHQESIKMNMVISATSTLRGAPPVLMHTSSLAGNNALTAEEINKTFKLAMQCKCKLFVQSASSKWNSFGSVYLKISQQYTSKKMHIAIESHKGGKTTQLVRAMVQSRNVERLGPKRISFLMIDELERNSVVYMVQVREELTGDKICEYIKTKNAENGW